MPRESLGRFSATADASRRQPGPSRERRSPSWDTEPWETAGKGRGGREDVTGGGRLRMFGPALLFAIAVAATAFVVGNRTGLVDGSYEIDDLRTRLEELKLRNRQLRLEIASLTAPSAVESGVKELRLAPPTAEQIRTIPPVHGGLESRERGTGGKGRESEP